MRIHPCMTAQLANSEDARLVLKLYELRTESVMREARAWATDIFWPESAQEVLDVFAEMGSQENHYLRQVTSYWEMAAAFVLHGALSQELFVECNSEPFFLYAKFEPLLEGIRKMRPSFLIKTGDLIANSSLARQRFEAMVQSVASRNALSHSR
jgi:hypothetical protein